MAIKKLSSEEIRRHKGVSFPGVTTVFFCHDGQGKLLLSKRGPKARDEHGRWDAGGGGLKHGQTVENNLKREVKEEYNASAKRVDFIGYHDAFRELPDGTPTHWLAMCFAVLVDPAEVCINEPGMIDEIGWFDLENLPKPMHSQFNIFYKKHRPKLKAALGIE